MGRGTRAGAAARNRPSRGRHQGMTKSRATYAFSRVCWLCLCAVGLWLPGGLAAARADDAAERAAAVKAGLLYNFTVFIDWPQEVFASAEAPFRMQIVDQAAAGTAFRALAAKTVKGRKIFIDRYDGPGLERGPAPHLLFLNTTDKKLIERILHDVAGRPVVTVGEVCGFAEMGGTINILNEQDRVSLEINVDAARRAGVTISSRLLKLKRVRIVTDSDAGSNVCPESR